MWQNRIMQSWMDMVGTQELPGVVRLNGLMPREPQRGPSLNYQEFISKGHLLGDFSVLYDSLLLRNSSVAVMEMYYSGLLLWECHWWMVAQAIAPWVHHSIHAQGHPSHGLLSASFWVWKERSKANYFLQDCKDFLILDFGSRIPMGLAKAFLMLQS